MRSNQICWKPDVFVDVVLYPIEDGGRAEPLSGDWFGCPFRMPNGDLHDARLDLSSHGVFLPGARAALPLKFLYPERALPKVAVGTVMKMWDGRVIGTATVTRVVSQS